jgi:uncharacterized protein DUF1329
MEEHNDCKQAWEFAVFDSPAAKIKEERIMRYLFKTRPYLLIGIIGLMLVLMTPSAWADELKEGTVIKAENIDKMRAQKFEGKTIASMLPEKIEWMIRNHGLTITLRNSKPHPVDPRWIEATKKYSGEVKFDPETRNVTGYKAGLAFPNITDDDPHKAAKLIWNQYLTGGWPHSDLEWLPEFIYLMIDGKKGIEREMIWTFYRVWGSSRLTGDDPVIDDEIYYKQIMMGLEPYDIRGIGSFRIRYNSGKDDDAWAYLRNVRRTRRLSGGGWFDPIGGTDQLADEMAMFSAYPTWYPEYKYIGKRHILAIAHTRGTNYVPDSGNPYPNFDLKTPPYWNFDNTWEPREVYVVEATMPPEHPYSRRVYYFDAKSWVPYLMEAYNKKGEFVKEFIIEYQVVPGMDTPHSYDIRTYGGTFIDFQRMHSTNFVTGPAHRRNPPGMGFDDVTLGRMEAIAKGKWDPPEFKEPAEGKPMYLDDFDLDWKTLQLK